MKKQFIRASLCVFLLFSLLQACKKGSGGGDNSATGNDFSDSIRNIVPQTIIDSLRSWGLKINDGKTPPTIAGIFLLSPDSCIFDNSRFHQAGDTIDAYKIRFSNQNNNKLTIRVDRKDISSNTDVASDSLATYISGNGNYFTIFAQEKSVASDVSYTSLEIYSGQITAAGIADFQLAFYMKEKGPDPNNEAVNPGDTRIFVNEGGLIRSVDTYSIDPVIHQHVLGQHSMMGGVRKN